MTVTTTAGLILVGSGSKSNTAIVTAAATKPKGCRFPSRRPAEQLAGLLVLSAAKIESAPEGERSSPVALNVAGITSAAAWAEKDAVKLNPRSDQSADPT